MSPSAPDQDDIIYQSDRTLVYRRTLAGSNQRVICKQTLGPHAAARFRHEKRILERLCGIQGVPQLIAIPVQVTASNLICLEDTDAASLTHVLQSRPMKPSVLLDFALQLTHILAATHRAGVVHKDINPTNILLAGPDRSPMLTDFDLATTFAEERPGFVQAHEIAGSLAYLSPELTGRTGRSVDQRADLYALGALFYELAVGCAPFEGNDPLHLIHDILTRAPTPPIELNRDLPSAFSWIILRLLAKEPDQRYQSAEGLAHDLVRVQEQTHSKSQGNTFPLGVRDFPLKLLPPSRLVGRDNDIDALQMAFNDALRQGGGVLVTGAPGVGKSALISELRSIVSARNGWYVSGKFDQHRRDATADGAGQALRNLIRLLLTESETELTKHREQIRIALGGNAGLITSILPEFSLILNAIPEVTTDDPIKTGKRIIQGTLDLLRAVASPMQPLVMVIDDLQWAPVASIAFIDALLDEGNLPGLLLVASYRDNEVDATHPLSAMLTRWERLDAAPIMLRLNNLPDDDLSTLLSEMLRLPPTEAAGLATAIGARTQGNPFDTVELVNALRRDGALTPSETGWQWDEATIRRFIGQGEVIDLLTARIDRLPDDARVLLEIMACLGGEMVLELLATASGFSTDMLEMQLTPALEDGLLVMGQSGEMNAESAVRFRHDRVQQAAYSRQVEATRSQYHLTIARRLAAVSKFAAIAAEQYVLAVSIIEDADESRRVVALLHDAATQARQASGHLMAERFLSTALVLLGSAQTATDTVLRGTLEIARHNALYSLGHLDEADELYESIAAHCLDPIALAAAASAQINSMTNRNRMQEALTLGHSLLERLGLPVPQADDIGAAIEQGMNALARWTTEADQSLDVIQQELNDPRVLALAKLLYKLQTPAFVTNPMMYAWQALQSHYLWAKHGPCADLMSGLSSAPMLFIAMRQDYRSAYDTARKVIAIGEARGYEAATCYAIYVFEYCQAHWFEPLEAGTEQVQRAREGLLRDGNLQIAAYTYYVSVIALLDCAPALDACIDETASGLSFIARTSNDYMGAEISTYRQLVRALRGETHAQGSFNDADFDETTYLADMKSPVYFHVQRALSAAIFGDEQALVKNAAASMSFIPGIPGFYITALAHILYSLSLCHRLKAVSGEEQSSLLSELNTSRMWLTARADDAPMNFRHLQHWIEAERSWALGDVWDATEAFDAALREVKQQSRPWHSALITERTGLCHLEQGLEYTGCSLLGEAHRLYEAWGASAKVRQMTSRYDFLRNASHNASSFSQRENRRQDKHHSASVTTDSIDLIGILRASQALSSETSLSKLRLRMGELLKELSGATHLSGATWFEDKQQWCMVPTEAESDISITRQPISVEEAAQRSYLPLTAFRYIERTRQPLLVENIQHDDRFNLDPYFANLERCSLLGVPVFSKDVLRLIIIMENRLSHSAFSQDRLQAVQLIAGQLAVSMDNAMLYESLERKVAERTEALEEANRQLAALAVTDALTGLANRRRFDETIEAEWVRAIRPQTAMAVAMIDIDQFKLYNDHYGHQGGDECLRKVSKALGESIRGDADLVARYGGEEFVIVLPGTGLEAALVVAERARAAVEALHEPHAKASSGIVTISVGVASVVPTVQENTEQLIELADAALYRAKKNGRNQVVGRKPE